MEITGVTMFNFGWKTKAIGFVVLLAVGFAYSLYAKEQNAGFAKAPQVGDVYTVKLKAFIPSYSQNAYPYSVMKIESVQNGQVTFNLSNATYGNHKSVRKSLRADGANADFYSGETIDVAVDQLARLVESDDISDIER
jgi:hypothetical protein